MRDIQFAFPHPSGAQGADGMALRDFFAAFAMAADIAAGVTNGSDNTMADYAEDAYRMADAMIAARDA